MVVSYFLFRCVLVTFVGGVSSSAYASLDDGMAHYDNYNRTSVRYALITYCCAASSERNSSYQLCCSNGNRDSNTNATMRQQDLGAAAVCSRKHYGCRWRFE